MRGKVNEIEGGLGAWIAVGDRLSQGFDQDGRHDVLACGVGEPFSRRFDPHDPIEFDGRVAAGRLRTEGIGAKRSRQFHERAIFDVAGRRGRHCANSGTRAPNQAAKALRSASVK